MLNRLTLVMAFMVFQAIGMAFTETTLASMAVYFGFWMIFFWWFDATFISQQELINHLKKLQEEESNKNVD